MYIWNTWHGCHPCSDGCRHCPMLENDKRLGIDSTIIRRTAGQFQLPLLKSHSKKKDPVTNRCDVQYKIPGGSTILTCNTSDFFIEEADKWRDNIWDIIKQRQDCLFIITTKIPENIEYRLPKQWNNGWENVAINVTVENNECAWDRIPTLLELPIKHIGICLEPLLEEIDISPFLSSGLIENITLCGESHFGVFENEARPLNINWVKNIQQQCKIYDTNFEFTKTGSIIIDNNGKKVRIFKKDEGNLAKFFDLDFKSDNCIDWDKLPKQLEINNLRSEAYQLYFKIENNILTI